MILMISKFPIFSTPPDNAKTRDPEIGDPERDSETSSE
jgi:hypothetical protein